MPDPMPAGPLITTTYLPPIARKRRLLPQQIVVVSLMSCEPTSQPEKENPRPSSGFGSTTLIEPFATRPTAEPLKFRYTLPIPPFTERVPSSFPDSAKPTAGTARAIASTVSQTRRLIDARSIQAAGVPSMRGLEGVRQRGQCTD